jgi:hypothetical protein
VTTIRTVQTEITNLLDYLLQSEIAVYTQPPVAYHTRVTWAGGQTDRKLWINKGDPSLRDYVTWVTNKAYSTILRDGALIQITYDVIDGEIAGHRLAYVPCPYRLDEEMVASDAILEIIDLHVDSEPTNMVLHSTVRFDFDPKSEKSGHPSTHLTINSPECRIACAAPMHVGRFADFVFKHFYPELWKAHRPYFEGGARQEAGLRTLTDEDAAGPHISWR